MIKLNTGKFEKLIVFASVCYVLRFSKLIWQTWKIAPSKFQVSYPVPYSYVGKVVFIPNKNSYFVPKRLKVSFFSIPYEEKTSKKSKFPDVRCCIRKAGILPNENSSFVWKTTKIPQTSQIFQYATPSKREKDRFCTELKSYLKFHLNHLSLTPR